MEHRKILSSDLSSNRIISDNYRLNNWATPPRLVVVIYHPTGKIIQLDQAIYVTCGVVIPSNLLSGWYTQIPRYGSFPGDTVISSN